MTDSHELAQTISEAAADAKAMDISVFDLRKKSSITQFAVICTATSVPHLRSILHKVEERIELCLHTCPVYTERTPQPRWAVLDYIDVMLHVMTPEMRSFYELEKFWDEADQEKP